MRTSTIMVYILLALIIGLASAIGSAFGVSDNMAGMAVMNMTTSNLTKMTNTTSNATSMEMKNGMNITNGTSKMKDHICMMMNGSCMTVNNT
jgi:hypothetical protein